LLKKRLSDRQVAVAYEYLTRTDYDVSGGMLGFATYGGRVNAVAPDATASAGRNAIFDIACNTGWLDAQEEAMNVAWAREFYRDLFAEMAHDLLSGELWSTSAQTPQQPSSRCYTSIAAAHVATSS
jgi:hypothetical protein